MNIANTDITRALVVRNVACPDHLTIVSGAAAERVYLHRVTLWLGSSTMDTEIRQLSGIMVNP